MKIIVKTCAIICLPLFMLGSCNSPQNNDESFMNTKCHEEPEDEQVSLCATYKKNANDEGYTITIDAEVPFNAGFEIVEGPDNCRVNESPARCFSVTATEAGSGQKTYNKVIVIKPEQVRNEDSIQIVLNTVPTSGQYFKVGRKVIIARDTNKQEFAGQHSR